MFIVAKMFFYMQITQKTKRDVIYLIGKCYGKGNSGTLPRSAIQNKLFTNKKIYFNLFQIQIIFAF